MSRGKWVPRDDPVDPVSSTPLRDALLELCAELLAAADREEEDAARLRSYAKRLARLDLVYGTLKPEPRQLRPLPTPLTDRIAAREAARAEKTA